MGGTRVLVDRLWTDGAIERGGFQRSTVIRLDIRRRVCWEDYANSRRLTLLIGRELWDTRPNQIIAIILFCKPSCNSVFMFINSPLQIISHACVNYIFVFVSYNVDEVVMISHNSNLIKNNHSRTPVNPHSLSFRSLIAVIPSTARNPFALKHCDQQNEVFFCQGISHSFAYGPARVRNDNGKVRNDNTINWNGSFFPTFPILLTQHK